MISILGDLTNMEVCHRAVNRHFDEVYQFVADMGGAGYIFTTENDAAIMYNSCTINLNILKACLERNVRNIFIPPRRVSIQNIIKGTR